MEVADVGTILGLSWLRVWKGADHEAACTAVAEARAGRTGRFQGFCATHRGTPKWWDIVISPLPGADGTPERLVSIGRDITDAKQIEQKLALSQERLDLALGASGMVGIWDWDLRADMVHADANFARICTVDAAWAVQGAPLAQYVRNIHPDDLPAFRAKVDALLAGVEDFASEYRIVQEDGTVRWLDARGRLVRDEAGTPIRFPGASVDITDRKQAEMRRVGLLELGDRLRDLSDPAEMAFVAAGIMGRTLDVSRAGYGTVDAAGETITIERDWTAAGVASLSGTLRFRDFGSFIDDLKRGDAVICTDVLHDPRTIAKAAALQAVSVRSIVNLPVFEHGSFVALFFLNSARPRRWTVEEIGFVRNVADRTRTAIERRQAEHRLQELAATLEQQVTERTRERDQIWKLSRDLIVIVGAAGQCLAANPAWCNLFGTAATVAGTARFCGFVHPDDQARVEALFLLMVAGRPVAEFEARMHTQDGAHRLVSWVVVAAGGECYATGRDVTDQRAVEEALRQSQKMEAVGHLTGGLAHDFNNLLTGIAGSLELLSTRLSQGRVGDAGRYIAAAQDAAKRAAALTHRLLAFSRRQTLDPKATDVNHLIRDMEDLIRRTVGPQVVIEVIGAAGLWTALVDPPQLENALLNLCINARDAMPDGGWMTIETANAWLDEQAAREHQLPAGQYLSLSVTDTGVGMTPEVIARAFDPFFTTKPIGQGTGLGLSMIYGFTQQSGGQIQIESAVGQGTTMRLYLPRHHGQDNAAVDEAGRPADRPRAEQGQVVLVVDDEPTVRMLVTEVLQDLGYTTLEAADGVTGLKLLQSDPRITLLVTDVGLPGGLNGRQVADAARIARPGLKVLFITGYAETAAIGSDHLDPGMHVLTKPFALETLASRIAELAASP